MPKSSITKKSNKSTVSTNLIKALGPNFVSKETWDKARGWTNEYDIDNFVDIFLSSGKFPIYYNYINNLLLFIRFNHSPAGDIINKFKNDVKKDILEYIMEYGDEIDNQIVDINKSKLEILQRLSEDGPSTPIFFIQQILNSAYELYNALNQFPILSLKYPFGLPQPLKTLYHGLEYLEVPLFEHLLQTDLKSIESGSSHPIISWPLFMSTTLDKNVAYRFSSKYSSGNKALFEIIIPDTAYSIIKYTYLGKTIVLNDTLVQLNSEVELLLNMGFQFQLQKVQYDIKKQFVRPDIIGSHKEEDIFDIYTFQFKNYTNMKPFFEKVINDPNIAEAVMSKFGKSKK